MRGRGIDFTGMGKKSCKDCPDRYLGCHDYCEKYLSDRDEWSRKKELKRKSEEFYVYKIEKMKKDEKRRSKHGK